jgi:TonB family protein
MNSAINFLIESGVSLAFLSLIYILFLRKETFFRLNRIFLLVSVAFSLLLPFMHLKVLEPQSVMLSEVTVTPYRNLVEAVTVYGQDFSGAATQIISSSRLIILIYLLGLSFFSIRFFIRIAQVVQLIRKNEVQIHNKVKFVLIDQDFSPFSFLNYVFINPGHREESGYEKIVAHEIEHIRQGHSFDVLLLEILTILQWFNPFMWMLKRVIRENHEFLADRAVLDSGVNAGHYKQLLLNQAVGFQLEMANNFNTSLIKKRIKMISKIKSSKLANLKYALGALSLLALLLVFACEQKEKVEIDPMTTTKQDPSSVQLKIDGEKVKLDGSEIALQQIEEILGSGQNLSLIKDSLGDVYITKKAVITTKTLDDNEEVFFVVEEMPEFPGGDVALRKFIANNVKYPESAQKNGIQGKVYVSFVVGKDGYVKNAKIVRGVDPALDAEALRVVNLQPKWKPGTQRGVAVNIQYTVPINFALQ